MKYENTNHKIHNLWIEIHKLDNSLNKQIININKTKSNFKQLIYNIKDIGINYSSTDWLQITGNVDVGIYPRYYYEWNIIFNKMDIRLLPFFNVNIVYNHTSDISFELYYRGAIRRKDIIFQIEDLGEEDAALYGEYIKKVTCIYFFLLEQDTYYPKQKVNVKLLFTISNPRQYV